MVYFVPLFSFEYLFQDIRMFSVMDLDLSDDKF